MAVLAFSFVVAALYSPASASHSWGGYHWARASNPLTLDLGDNVSPIWDGHLATASADWSQSSVLDTYVVAGKAKSLQNCRPPAGRVEVCNSAYGNNGWLGIAQIWISDGVHITQGSVKLNDTYFNRPQYNTPAWRQFVTCQEIGHTFGLDHQDENFDNPNLGTCMDYTSNPTTNQHPNQHDYAQLESIYAHLDSGATNPSSRGGSGVDLDSPSEWGRVMKSSHGGRLQMFEHDLGNNQRIVTFVIWA
jgi:hypothetical protein